MSQRILQGPAGINGVYAPPIDRSAPPATTRWAAKPWNKSIQRKTPNEAVLRRCCAASALRRRPSQPNAGTVSGTDASSSSRTSQLYDLDRVGAYNATTPTSQPPPSMAVPSADSGNSAFLDEGWGVAAVETSTPTTPKPVAKRDKRKPNRQLAAALAAAVPSDSKTPKPVATPFFEMSSEAGLTGLTLLQARLIEEGRVAHSPERKAEAAAAAEARRVRQAATVRRKRDWVDPDELDVGEGEAEEVCLEQNKQQYFELNLEADGSLEVVDFDDEGRVQGRRAPGTVGVASRRHSRNRGGPDGDGDDDDDDPLAFLADDYDLEEADEGVEEDDGVYVRRAASNAAAGTSLSGPVTTTGVSHSRGGLYDNRDEDENEERQQGSRNRRPLPGQDPLADEEVEWGLDELRPMGRPSLMRELGVIKKKTSKKLQQQQPSHLQGQAQEQEQKQSGATGKAKEAAAGPSTKAGIVTQAAGAAAPTSESYDEDDEDEYDEERDVSVAWGGSGGASGIDMEQQEALLSRLFKPHKVKELMAHQRAAEAELAAMKRKASGRQVLESKVHSRMRIIAGSAAGRQLASSQGATTRPMMEKVRQAIFNMIQAQASSAGGLPETSRWLDFFAGTGSVGLEALSRGCRECHFIELDPWVCRKVLSKNISACGFQRRSVVHTMKAEDFLRKSIDLPRFAGGPFDFISVCPPYLVVSYPELMDLLERSPLLHERSIVFVEYPKQLAHQVPSILRSLVTVRDRKYGRTFIRVYGPPGGPADEGEGHERSSALDEAEDGDELLLL